ncbi:hypothetical protein [Desulfopila aestuarii]|uniref:Cupin domain-containing protein n=1 Tax=Desulfopila aestuarii DSM 18488 TaxID=1121416 RepID=A0A1M7XY19_9BACT|nr:hypothetical protein [Desulfopila aestuarii]SHO43891.1 hypothetical protein SAMN02745220_00558 [Desulfopila aestuarii DSM 18488]
MEKSAASESKYGKYIVKQTMAELNISEPQHNTSPLSYPGAITTISLGGHVLEGSFLLRNRWFLEPSETAHEPVAHAHDTDEALAFFGSNGKDWKDLGGEIEFWIENEKHVITESCVIFIPKGTMHCPLWIKKVVSPIFHYAVLPTTTYIKVREENCL